MAKYGSLAEMFEEVTRYAVDECLLCGECMEKCPMIPLLPLKDNNPTAVVGKIMDLLKDGVFSEDAYHAVWSCSACGQCLNICPVDINPMLVRKAAKIELTKQGKEPEVLKFVRPEQRISFHEIVSALQTKRSEMRWFKTLSSSREKVDTTVWLGCSFPLLSDEALALLDILEKMGLNFVAVGGGDLCCGESIFPAGGRVDEAEEVARKLVGVLQAFSPKRVLHICPGCYYQFTEMYPNYIDIDFENIFYLDFLLENLGKMKFTKRLEKRLAIHNGCLPPRIGLDISSVKMLDAVPGLKVVVREDKEQHLCCGGLANMTYPEYGHIVGRRNLLVLVKDAIKERADYIVSTCSFCRLSYYRYMRGFSSTLESKPGIRGIASLINESMGGIEYEDKLGKYWNSGSIEEIIRESKEIFEENGFSEEEMRRFLPLIFSF